MTASAERLQPLLDSIAADMATETDRGKVADYIPSLARVPIDRFGIAVTLADGSMHMAGDSETGFSVQSVSKVFALTLALGKVGDRLWNRVGREPSGSSFNSVVQLEHEQGIPRNPFINAGALVVTDVNLAGYRPRETIGETLRFLHYLAGDEHIIVDREVAQSEQQTGYRNAALANYMASFGNMHHPVELVLGTYFHTCAIEMNCRQLAQAGRFLMLGGRHPDGGRVIPARRARRILSLMLTCGQYDASGDFAFRVGIPAKSGVGGGILAVVPGIASIAVWSPGLGPHGNSLLGDVALERLSEAMDWSVFRDK